jgi:glycosyltransferase involved in cell wall biosynthesis
MQNLENNSSNQDVAILMGVYNGEKYLQQQLQSFLSQSHRNWRLYASDDGSSDQTLQILKDFQKQIGQERVHIGMGPQKGFARNFMQLLTNTRIESEYYALSDQDDIWEEKKISAAIEILKDIDTKIPALYCGRTLFVDENNNNIGLSNKPGCKPSFQNALVQNIASGNTMIINRAARDLLIQCGDEIDLYAHDWWIYLLISGAGGVVYYDENPYLRYRQHSLNQIGMNSKFEDKLKRINQLLAGDFAEWNRKNIIALNENRQFLDFDNLKALDSFELACKYNGLKSVYYLYRSCAFRQKYYQNIALYFGALIGRL